LFCCTLPPTHAIFGLDLLSTSFGLVFSACLMQAKLLPPVFFRSCLAGQTQLNCGGLDLSVATLPPLHSGFCPPGVGVTIVGTIWAWRECVGLEPAVRSFAGLMPSQLNCSVSKTAVPP